MSCTIGRGLAALLLTGLAFSRSAHADAADYVFVPYADKGVWSAAYDAGTEAGDQGGRERGQDLSLGVSPTARWFTQVYAGWYGEPGEAVKFYAWSWLNHFQLTDPAKGPLNFGLYVNAERPLERDQGNGLTVGPTIQWDGERTQVNLNIFFEKYFNAVVGAGAELKYQMQAKWLWGPGFEVGAQGFGDVGPWRHWEPLNEQEHDLGPAVFAKWRLAGGRSLQADAAVLFGMTSASPSSTLRLRMRYDF